MMLLPFYRSAVRQFDSRVRAVRPEQWSASTPDADWDVHRLVRHVIADQLCVPALLAGQHSSEFVAESTLGSGPELVESWAVVSAAAVEAFRETQGELDRLVRLPDGDVPAEEFGWHLVTELTVHAWDLARAIGAPDEFPNDLVANVLGQTKQSADRWLSGERYGPPIPVPGCTDDLTELLALTGRTRWWRRGVA